MDDSGSARASIPDDGRVYRPVLEPHGCFVCGDRNPVGLHLPLRLLPGRAWADLTLSHHYEGWQGVAHGGILAALLDEVMAWSLFGLDAWGVTAELTARYRRPVPVGEPIRAEGWLTEVRGRMMRSAARIADHDGRELCSGEGTYLAAPPPRAVEMRRRYRFRVEPVDDRLPAHPRANGGTS